MREENPLPASRARLAAVLRATKEVVSIDATAKKLGLDRTAAAKLLSRWRTQGWLRRIGQGLYVPVPLDLAGSAQVVEDPWVLVPTLFGQCYIGGWTAAHHWDLTEQLFNETVVFTTKRISAKRVTAQGVGFLLHHTAQKRLFGLKAIWRGSQRVNISDPARTLIDMLAMPDTGGGIDHVADCLAAHRKSPTYSGDLLARYAEQFGNGAVFKRLGFLAQTRLHDPDLAAACRERLTQGYAQLDPALPASHLHTAWRLWVPERWREAAP
jgi:predicted transcriptional regulator of viral defense system